jgi:serine phosphatase RsbU (regulator of sigma subunit)
MNTSYSMVLHNIGVLLFDMKQYDKAMEYQQIALDSALKNNDEYSAARAMMSVADVYSAQKNYKKAEEFALKGLEIIEKEGDKDEMKNCYSSIAFIYSQSKNFKEAFIYQQKLQAVYEEINNNEVNKRIGQMQAMYEADKKQKAIELLTKDNEIQNERIVRQNLVNYVAVAGIVLLLILAFMMFKRYREKQKANIEITHQKELIEVKNKEILDSIYYARRIQRALLASDNLLKKNLPDHFVLYKPKDIVSGDFYWAQNTVDNKFLLATCDCTGHGVPGAFMSLLNISKLTETVNEKKITQPNLVFSHVREEIIKALSSDTNEETTRDGMDAVCCSFDFDNKQMQFAAANNSLIIVRKKEILEYKADKFPVGLHQGELKPFTLRTIELQKDDCVYTFTDGFSDQFGGDRGKKLMSKKFKEILASIADKPMETQKIELETHFDNWRGTIEQVDDVLVIGIRI